MPTPATHALVGAALGRAAPSTMSRTRCAAVLALTAVLPDLDLAAFHLGIPYDSPLGHRGLLHSLLVAALLAALATVAVIGSRRFEPRDALAVTLLAFAAAASHGLLDAATNGGQGVAFLLPFSTERIFLPFRPIIVSPINPARFLSRAARVLASEALWVWLPLVSIFLAARVVRSASRLVAGDLTGESRRQPCPIADAPRPTTLDPPNSP